ncbi:MAG: hypothetical protein NC925_01115 [Candidatus Omnitrophica bacterium]|nr:hypothetical protein [Candidatus Omnitrophota bacterium]MCM8831666.1 hypothetical protein [Candidatus Omnitrophota bacterium]
MAKREKTTVTPVTPQKTEDKPAQTTSWATQKDTSCGGSSSKTPSATSKP